MPIVIEYGDPRIAATLAANAGRYATTQDQRALALREQALAVSAAGQQSSDWNREFNSPAPYQTQQPQQVPPGDYIPGATGGTGMLPNGATMYYPEGMNVPAQEARTAQQVSDFQTKERLLDQSHKPALDIIHDMLDKGMISDAEAGRRTLDVMNGGSGGGGLTEDEYLNRARTVAGDRYDIASQLQDRRAYSQYQLQERRLSVAKDIAAAREAMKGNGDNAHEDRMRDQEFYTRTKDAYSAKLDDLKSAAKDLNAQIKALASPTDMHKSANSKNQQQLDDLWGKLSETRDSAKGYSDEFAGFAQKRAAAATQPSTRAKPNAPTTGPAGSTGQTYQQGDYVNVGGKRYKVVGFDKDGMPLVNPA